MTISNILSDWAFIQERSLGDGRNAFHGFAQFFPHTKGKLPRAHQALLAWEKLAPSKEGGPLPEEVIFLVIKKMIENLAAEGIKGEIAAINGLDLEGDELSVHKELKVRKHSTF